MMEESTQLEWSVFAFVTTMLFLKQVSVPVLHHVIGALTGFWIPFPVHRSHKDAYTMM